MTSKPRMCIMSHLSDAQELIALGEGARACQQINYAKMILRRYENRLGDDVDWGEYDKIWEECKTCYPI